MYYVYILSSNNRKVLYIGVTNDLARRVIEHKKKLVPGFSSKYNVTNLVYYQEFTQVKDAIKYEKQLKNWHRRWKFNLINRFNPRFEDLSRKWSLDSETSSE